MKALKLPDAVVMCQVIALLMLQHDATPVHPLDPVQRFSANARSTAYERAITNLDNAQHALSNLLIAHMRLMHHNRYDELCTQSDPTCHIALTLTHSPVYFLFNCLHF